ncbi:nacht nucleoside triphosphatase [Metarhizium guizhouense ARSEF 977]|uniref:Nacht nucleoside triphosphatase n=1 Tax=Metarhizium guizhouense (strain ARSEF 977) TaxID=1276136 RepID=A0A0B4HZY9_METGA|nr:nacht nucleoside triphosphatase [Metarhizium guizhouense ARSEF 977]
MDRLRSRRDARALTTLLGQGQGHASHEHIQDSKLNPAREHATGVTLTQIHPLPGVDVETDIDIIAIHGLDTGSPGTWTWKFNRPDRHDVNWLADNDMLPSRVGQARILTCDWPAELFERSDLIQKRIEELARLLLDGIQRRPSATNTSSRRGDRPIVFIASCLGGIILMKALVMAQYESCSTRSSPGRDTHAIIFLATPFRGTSFQDVANWAEPGLKAWAWIRGQKVTRRLDDVKGPTFDLVKLVGDFTRLCRDDGLDRVMTFYELGNTNLYHKLVDESSAIFDIVPNPLPLDRPHVTMNKFHGKDDPEYQKVAGKLEEFLHGIREGTVLNRADAWIRNQCYAADRLQIRRLSDEELPMEQCYINLAIIEQQCGRVSSGSGSGSNGADSTSQSYPFSILSRQKVQTPDKSIQVELKTLFNQRDRGDHGVIKPRRILIRGRAGVGKTTLCKKMVYDFIRQTSLHDSWTQWFDRLLWVPLRNLQRRPGQGYNLSLLFRDEYFRHHLGKDGLTREDLAAELSRKVDDSNSERTLFVLDGLDEVSQLLASSNEMSDFLTMLLNKPNVIVTSRPNTSLPAIRAFDLELETIGFYPDQVTEYIEKSFVDPGIKTTDLNKVKSVQSFLLKHQLIQDLVRIPILLDALCYTWNDHKYGNIPDTMTGIYRLIELKLWKKDILRLEKRHDGAQLFSFNLETAPRSTIKGFVKEEMDFLESLAFTGLYDNTVDFSLEHIHGISHYFTPGLLPDKTLPSLSFLRTSEPSSDYRNQNYHFIHQTYQEYFAARYFARQWNNPEGRLVLFSLNGGGREMKLSNPVEFLQEHKYAAGYNIFWRFVAGLLDAESGVKETLRFFQTIEQEPFDLLGPTHQRLIMHCLSEVSNELPIRKDLLARLTQWVLLEAHLISPCTIPREPECPEEVILAALEFVSGERKKRILCAVNKRLSDTTITALITLLRDEQETRSAAAEALKRQSNLSDQAIASLLALLEHEKEEVKFTAAEVLQDQSNLSDTAIASLSALLEHEQENVRFTAAKALPWRHYLSGTMITSLIARLEHKEQQVRSVAAKTLGSQYYLSDAAIKALETLLESKDYNDQIAAAEALHSQHELSDAGIARLIALLKDESSPAQSAAAKALSAQYFLSDTATANFLALLEHERKEIRSVAVEVLSCGIGLSDAANKALIVLLQSKDYGVRAAAARALNPQKNLPDAAIEALLMLLQSKDSSIQIDAARALYGQQNLPDEAVEDLMKAQFRKYHSWTARVVFGAWNLQSNLSNAAIESLIALFQAKELNVQTSIANLLARHPNLVDKILKTLGLLLETEQPAELINSIFRNSQFLKLVYGILLQESFGSHISLYVRSDGGSCRCILNQPAGRRTASFEESGVADEFHNLVGDCQKYWNKHGYKLWDSFGVDASQ